LQNLTTGQLLSLRAWLRIFCQNLCSIVPNFPDWERLKI
jgi:hypothetical protein